MDLPVLARVGRDSLPILETHKFVVVVVQVLAIRVGLANHGNESVTVVLLGILVVCVHAHPPVDPGHLAPFHRSRAPRGPTLNPRD